MGWINPNETLPIAGDRVLICVDGCFVCEAYLTAAKKWERFGVKIEGLFVGAEVTGWMPMPKGTACEKNEKEET